MSVCIYHQEQTTHDVAIATPSLNQVFACRSGDQSYNNTTYSSKEHYMKKLRFLAFTKSTNIYKAYIYVLPARVYLLFNRALTERATLEGNGEMVYET